MEKSDFIQLEAAMARDWLNMQVKVFAMQKATHILNESISVVMPNDRIHMYRGIADIAELLGLKLKEKHRTFDYPYSWEYSFVYGGAEFYQIERERLEKYAGEADKRVSDGQVPADAGTV